MKKTSLLIFMVLLVVSVVWAGVLVFHTSSRFTARNELVGKKLVERFTTNDVAEIRIADEKNEVVLKRKDGKWVVANRGDYPVDTEKEIQRLVASLLSLQVGLEIPAEDKHYALMRLLSPDEKDRIEKFKAAEEKKGDENPASPNGLLIALKGNDGSELVHLVLGEEFGGDPSQPRRGIVVRSIAGHQGAWKVLGTVNRRTGDLGGTEARRGNLPEAKAWLAYDFLKIEKIKSITLTAPNDKDFKPWTASRATEEGDFTIDGLAADEQLKPGSNTDFKSLFASLHFEDVLDPAEAEKKKDTPNARQAVITTFDGLTYTFDLSPIVAAEPSEDSEATPPAAGNYIGTVKLEAALKETRDKPEGETEERAKAEDQAHALLLENLKDKVAREKAFEGRPFEFARFTMNGLLKSREDLIEKKPADPPAGESIPGTPSPGAFTPPSVNRPTAVTPPVRVPPVTPPDE